ncbi:uncharacterized protein B0P05DRAFT_570449 [Gilbertella persicaria]|uniref:uncharacterized protein n=1 Tax=Gilbertella persicaria TaxID=101096 RepID=UPI00221FFEE6|nr:uncharacterized protein B0P05DRAFT_570449 [Gilbertella persicaria]KAI8084043.1 hypothetical protein B0P05DRAFT_570449 [Gilbertella persicaria]
MVIYSKYPHREYPNDTSLYNLIFSKDRTVVPQDKLIYTDIENPERSVTFAQAHIQILKTGANLQNKFGFQKDDVIAICSPNQVAYPILLLGAHTIGGISAAIDHASSPERIASDFDIARPKLVVAHIDTIDSVLAAAKIYGLDESHILIFGDTDMKGARTVDATLLSGDELATPYEYTPEQIGNDPAYLYFTSGTTGRKKAVKVTQRMIITSLILIEEFSLPSANMLAYTEFHHASSLLTAIHQPLYCGITVYVMPHFTFIGICEAIQKYKIAFMVAQPYIVSSMAKDKIAAEYDFSSLQCIMCCGAALDQNITLTAKERLGLNVINGFGMTELFGLFRTTPAITLANGLGYLAPGYSAKLINDEGNEVPIGQMGELCVKGPTMTTGYYRNPEATAALIDTEGYLHTGDLLRCDEEGMFYYVDRSKDLIKYGLEHIYPSDIENVLMTHPKVSDCAVIGFYSQELTTELPRAYVLLASHEKYSEAVERELKEYADSRLPDRKRLRGGLIIVKSFPRTASGKIQRRLLRQQANEATKA